MLDKMCGTRTLIVQDDCNSQPSHGLKSNQLGQLARLHAASFVVGMEKTRTGPKVNSSSKPKYTISYTVDSSPCSNSAKETIAMAQTAIMSLN